MALENETGEKTEDPSGKRLGQSRTDGQVGKSVDLSMIAGMTGAFLSLTYIGPLLWADMITLFKSSFSFSDTAVLTEASSLRSGFISIVIMLLPKILMILLIAAACGAGSTALQTNFLWSWKLLRPKFDNLNPISGIKRLFSLKNALNLAKSIIKLAIIGPLGYFAFMDFFPGMLSLMSAPHSHLLAFVGEGLAHAFWRIVSLLSVLGILDLVYQKWSTHRQLKMTKVEVKEERKAVEGDETTKRRILAEGLKRARSRMMKDVPTADVVVTNPTHYAVALKYDSSQYAAPTVVAKGKGFVALRIREIALENKVPVIERKQLARSLFASVEIGNMIPQELYAAVADLLAYVYRLRGKHRAYGKK